MSDDIGRLTVDDARSTDGRVYLTAGLRALAMVFDLQLRGKTLEDARRLAACWNACRGIPTETLERASVTVLAVSEPGAPDADGRVSAPVPTPRYVIDVERATAERDIRQKLIDLGWAPPRGVSP